LVIADFQTAGRIWTVLNDGTGTLDYAHAHQWALPGAGSGSAVDPVAIVVADFNTDGLPDVAVANVNSDTMAVILNKGGGSFAAGTRDAEYAVGLGTSAKPAAIAAGRLNDDDFPDLATANRFDNSVTIWFGSTTTAGTFDATTNIMVAHD